MTWLVPLFFVFSLFTSHAYAQVEVTATVDRNEAALGDVINYVITVKAQNSVQVNEPRLVHLDGFELINTSSGVETRSTYAGGRFITEQSRVFNYMLAVAKKGNLTIPAVSIEIDGKSYPTKPITIAVSGDRRPQPQNQQANQDPFEQMDEMEEIFNRMLQRRLAPNLHGGQRQGGEAVNPEDAFSIQSIVDKTTAYVGEQVVANFYLYTRGQIRDIDTLKYPDLKGFWKEDLEMATRLNFEPVVINGIQHQRALLVSYALFPIKAGPATIDGYKAKCTVLTPSMFGFGRPQQFTKASRNIQIDVKPIPTEGRPANFTGAVGDYRVTAQFEPTTGITNQPVTLRIRFAGRGNAKLIELPKLDLPSALEIYDQKSQARFLKDGTSYKEFEVLIVPRQPGIYEINPIEVATFDPGSKKFRSIATNALKLAVTGQGAPPEVSPLVKADKKPEDNAPKGPRLPELASDIGEVSLASSPTAPIVTGILYMLVFGFLSQQAWTRFRRKPKRVSLGMVLNRRLKRVHEAVGKKDWRRVGVELTNTAYYILGQLSEQGGANQDVNRLLEKTAPSLRNELADPIKKLLSGCEALSFAPESMIQQLTQPQQLQKLIGDFEKTMRRAIELAEI